MSQPNSRAAAGQRTDSGPFTMPGGRLTSQARRLISHLRQAVLLIAGDGTLMPANSAALALHGIAQEEDFPQSLDAYEVQFRFERGEPAQAAASPWRDALQGRPVIEQSYVLVERGTGHRVRVVCTAVEADDSMDPGALLLLIDKAADQEPLPTGAQILDHFNRVNFALARQFQLDEMVRAVCEAGTHLTGAEFGAFFYNVVDDRGESYTLYTLAGPLRDQFRHMPMPRNTAVFAPTFSGERIVRLDDVTSAPEYGRNAPHFGLPPGHPVVRSYLAAPVLSRSGEVLGGLFFGHERAGVFSGHTEQVVAGLAAQAAIAMANARALERLQRSERHTAQRFAELQSVYDSAPVGLCLVDQELRFTMINQRLAEMHGVPAAAHLGRTVGEVVPQIADLVGPHFRHVLSTGQVIQDMEIGGALADGIRRTWLSSYHPIRGDEGEIIGVSTIVQDITARKRRDAFNVLKQRTHEALTASATLADAAPAIITAVREAFEVEVGALWLPDDGNSPQLYCAYQATADALDCEAFRAATEQMRFASGVGLPGRVWQAGQPEWIGSLADGSEFPRARAARACGLCSGVAFPVANGSEVFGVFEFFFVAPVHWEESYTELLAGLGRDIGQFVYRRRAEAMARESEEKLRFTLQASQVGTWELDLATRYVRWSENMERIHGMEPGSFDGTFECYMEDVYPDDREHVTTTIQQALERGSDYHVEYRLNRDGGSRWVEGRGSVIVGEDGKPRRMAGVCTDISERKASEQRFRMAVEASPGAFVMVDGRGRINLVNHQTERLFGYERAELIGQPVEILVPDRWRSVHPTHREQFHAAPRARPMGMGSELTARHRNGREIPVVIGLNPIRIGREDYVLCAVTDISERMRTEREIRSINEQLRRKSEEMEEFVYTVSHDLKSPLVTAMGFIGMLKEDLVEGNQAEAMDAMERIERATLRMHHLIQDLLQLSRIGRVRMNLNPVDTGKILHELYDDYRDRLEEAGFQFKVSGYWPVILADGGRITELFDNLLNNALKYAKGDPRPRIEVGAMEEAGEDRFFVADNGPGIPAAYHKKIFRMFQRLDSDREGTGIGLAIVAKIAQLHGGRAWVESEEGKGARFWVSLPRRRPD